MATFTIARAESATPEVQALLGELDAELAAQYSPEQRHGLDVTSLFKPHVRFFIARRDDVAAGCGGIASFGAFAELKRMYVRPSARGTGIARALLARLEAEALSFGISTIRLETGTRQTAAIRLYERFGFRPCGAFGDYLSMPAPALETSLFFEKRATGERPG